MLPTIFDQTSTSGGIRFRFPDSVPGRKGPPLADNQTFEACLAVFRQAMDDAPLEQSAILQSQIQRIKGSRKEWLIRQGWESSPTGDGDRVWRLNAKQRLGGVFDGVFNALGDRPRKGWPFIDRAETFTDGKEIDAVRSFLDQGKVLEHAQNYRGGPPLSIRSVTAHLSRPLDRHHVQQFTDEANAVGHEEWLKIHPVLNLHVDPKPTVMKAMIYLSDVEEEHGPFSTIFGSHLWETNPVFRCFAWGNSIGNYLHTPHHRLAMGRLPEALRGNAIMGALLSPEEAAFCHERLFPFVSKDADVILFDPSFTWHRGGQVEEGERRVLQVVLR